MTSRGKAAANHSTCVMLTVVRKRPGRTASTLLLPFFLRSDDTLGLQENRATAALQHSLRDT